MWINCLISVILDVSIGGHFSGRLEFAMTTTAQPVLTTVDYFESIYAEADGESSRIPWADGQPASALVNWLNAVAPSLRQPNQSDASTSLESQAGPHEHSN